MKLNSKFRPLSSNAIRLAEVAIDLQIEGVGSIAEPLLLERLEAATVRRGGAKGSYWDHGKLQGAMMELYSLNDK